MSTHILIIEDDLTFSTMLSAWLRKKNFQVTTTSSVAAAIKLLLQAEHAPQLILSDLRLPDHDGLYLLQWLHSKQMFIPFIMMTSYAEVQNAVEAMKLGATDYISKPIQPDLLLQKSTRHFLHPLKQFLTLMPHKLITTASRIPHQLKAKQPPLQPQQSNPTLALKDIHPLPKNFTAWHLW